MGLKLMLKAECLDLVSVLELPEIKLLRRATDTNEPFDPCVTQGPPIMEWKKGPKVISIFDSFSRRCPNILSSRSTVADFVKLHTAIAVNAIGAPDEEFNGGLYHTSLFVAASFANHDCEPNASYVPENKLLAILGCAPPKHQVAVNYTAKRDIEQGEEITIGYCGSPSDPVAVRRAGLLNTYGFICQCAKCVSDEKEEERKKKKKKATADLKSEKDPETKLKPEMKENLEKHKK
jgi:hypothetical protein